MKTSIKYLRPGTLAEALCALNVENIKVLAGGTDIIPGLHQKSSRFSNIESLCDVSRLPEVNCIIQEDSNLKIGSAVTLTKLQQNKVIQDKFPLLAKAASLVGSVQIRNRATLGGNFINNAPCADSVPPLLVYNAGIKIQSFHGSREMSLQDFLVSPYKTQLAKNEIVTGIILPIPGIEYKGEFYKLGRRRAVSISRISFAVIAAIKNDMFDDIRIASGAITPIGTRFNALENFAKSKKINKEFLKELSVEFGKYIVNIAGIRWSAPYKIPTAQQMFYQALCNISGKNDPF